MFPGVTLTNSTGSNRSFMRLQCNSECQRKPDTRPERLEKPDYLDFTPGKSTPTCEYLVSTFWPRSVAADYSFCRRVYRNYGALGRLVRNLHKWNSVRSRKQRAKVKTDLEMLARVPLQIGTRLEKLAYGVPIGTAEERFHLWDGRQVFLWR